MLHVNVLNVIILGAWKFDKKNQMIILTKLTLTLKGPNWFLRS
jgi:hypothetical protein